MTRDELAQDLAYVRTLAEEGRHAPLLGGAHFLFWGLLNAGAYVTHWLVLSGGVSVNLAFVWAAYGVVAGIGSMWLSRRGRDKPGKASLGVRAEYAIWRGVVVALLAIVFGYLIRMVVASDWQAPNGIMGPALALFGAAMIATAMLARERWLAAFGALACAAAIVLVTFQNEPWAYLAAAAANLIVLAIPGLVLVRREPSAIV